MTRKAPLEPVLRRVDFASLSQAPRASQGVVSVSFKALNTSNEELERVVRVAYGVSSHTGNAVVRNGVRRRFRAVMMELPLAPGLYMVRPRRGILEASFQTIRSDLAAVCVRLGALQSEGELCVAQNSALPVSTGVFE
jgi:ribonuclease P protein component